MPKVLSQARKCHFTCMRFIGQSEIQTTDCITVFQSQIRIGKCDHTGPRVVSGATDCRFDIPRGD